MVHHKVSQTLYQTKRLRFRVKWLLSICFCVNFRKNLLLFDYRKFYSSYRSLKYAFLDICVRNRRVWQCGQDVTYVEQSQIHKMGKRFPHKVINF